MSLHIQSQKVIDFYKKNTNLSFEQINIFMVDMLEKMMQQNTPSLMAEMNNSMLILQKQMEEMNGKVSRIQEETTNTLSLKLLEMKDQYIEQVKMIVSNSLSEKVQPILKDYTSTFIDKTKLLLNEMVPKNQESMKKELNNSMSLLQQIIMKENQSYNPTKINDFILSMDTKLSNALKETNQYLTRNETRLETGFSQIKDISSNNQKDVSMLLQKMENSSCKGKISENLLNNILQHLYPCASIDSVGTQKETGDVMLTRKGKPTILIENKNWDKNVVQTEVQKFMRDCETQKCCGLFLSQQYGICNKENYEINIHDGNVLLYIHSVNYDQDKIKIGIDIIDHFKSNLAIINDKVDVNTIKKEVLDNIHREYTNYRLQKETLQKTVKETHQKLCKHVDDLQLPNLEGYLSLFYSFSSTKLKCEYCGFATDTRAGLSAHHRGCKIKKEKENK